MPLVLQHPLHSQRYAHKLHMEYPVAHMADQTEMDNGYLCIDVYHNLPSAIHSELQSRQSSQPNNHPHKRHPSYHKYCQNTETSMYHSKAAFCLTALCALPGHPSAWKPACNKLSPASYCHVIHLSPHSNVARS